MTFQETSSGGLMTSGPGVALSDYPGGAIPVTASSGNVANGVAAASLPGAVGKTTHIAGFTITGSGATVGAAVQVTLTGILGGTATFIYVFTAGVVLANTPLIVPFSRPIPASAPNTSIVVSCPAGGLGAAANAAMAYGYQL